MSSDGTVGWTEAEYRQCPELASRLHRRIQDLEAENERLREWPAKLLKLIEESWYDDRFGEGAYARALESNRTPEAASEH